MSRFQSRPQRPAPKPPRNEPVLLDATVGVVEVNFHFTNPSHIPPGISDINRGSDEWADKMMRSKAKQAGQAKLGEIGRVRNGRTDTGDDKIRNQSHVRADLVRKALTNNGYRLIGIGKFLKEETGKHVVRCTYVRHCQGEVYSALTRNQLEALRALASDAVWYAHVWDNPDFDAPVDGARTLSIVFVGRTPRERGHVLPGQNRLIIEDHNIKCVPDTQAAETEASSAVTDIEVAASVAVPTQS